jgi:hypothetical protein
MILTVWRVFRSVAPYLLVLLVVLFLWNEATRKPEPDLEARAAVEAKARELNAVQAQLVSEKALTATLHKDLQAFVDGMKKAGGVKKAPTGALSTAVTIKDTAAGTFTPPVQTLPFTWQDEYHRFKVDHPSGLLTRSQKFKIDIAAVIIDDGLYTKLDFREYDPVTGVEIPTTGILHEGTLRVSTYKKPTPFWHPRLVAVADHRGAVGVGAELINLKDKLNAGLVALYSGKQDEGRGGAFVGYRLFDSNVSVGAYGAVSTEGTLGVGGLLTVALTR